MALPGHLRTAPLAALGALLLLGPTPLLSTVWGAEGSSRPPAASPWLRVLLLRDYNTRVVAVGTTTLGVSAGLVGVFLLLRKRSLLGDVVGHASLPGVALAFIVMELVWPDRGRSMGGLLAGATLAGVLGVICLSAILRYTRIREDAALSIVLSVFFGMGVVLFTIIQELPTGNAAGLNKFIFGSAASMVVADAQLIAWVSFAVLAVCLLLMKELTVVCFDEAFAAAQGWPVRSLDYLLMGLVVAVAEVGAQSVGLVLVAALMIIPAAAARFWSDRLRWMCLAAAMVGGGGALVGVLISASAPRFATGAVIVLVSGILFAVSLFGGAARGVWWRWLRQRQLVARVGQHELLRAVYELLDTGPESHEPLPVEQLAGRSVSSSQLVEHRGWNTAQLGTLLGRAERAGLIHRQAESLGLSAAGAEAAWRAARNHRLWETYLVKYAELAPSHVDRMADDIEHVLGSEMVEELERAVREESSMS